MKAKGLRTQLRACTKCGKVGHNKSTCHQTLAKKLKPAAAAVTSNNLPTSNPPVKFFIHHTHFAPHQSAHFTDLKTKESDPWQKVSAAGPSRVDSTYHYYHQKSEPQKSSSVFSKHWEQNDDKKIPDEYFYQDIGLDIPKTSHATTLDQEKIQSKPALNLIGKDTHFKNQISNAKQKIKATGAKMRNVGRVFPIGKIAFAIGCVALAAFLPVRATNFYRQVQLTARTASAQGTAGFAALKSSTSALANSDLASAQKSTADALRNFSTALDNIKTNYPLLQSIIGFIPFIGDKIQDRKNLALAGEEIALGNARLFKGLEEIGNATDKNLLQKIKILNPYLSSALPDYRLALSKLTGVSPKSVPEQYRQTLNDFKLIFASVTNDLENLSELNNAINEIFGGQGMRRYLLMFQNPDEIRATGGFLGSFAVMDIKNGKIERLNIPAGGTYDLQGQLQETVEPPQPLSLVSRRWGFQDANWFPDFPASAQKILWFYRKSRDLTADGVIAINSTVLERLLTLTGPVSDEKRDVVLTAQDAIAQIQKIVETGPEIKDKKPKQIISDLAPEFLALTKNVANENLVSVLQNLHTALLQKEIQVYFTDENAQKLARVYGWSGELTPTTQNEDYLMVVNSNIGGRKSDAKMKQQVELQTVVEEDCEVINTVVVTRRHEGGKDEPFYGYPNIDYLRVYVPAGSELLSAAGFTWPEEKSFKAPFAWAKPDETLLSLEKEEKIDKASGTRVTSEFGKTAFGNWVITEPGATSQIQLTYKLPFKVTMNSSRSRLGDLILSGLEKENSARHLLVVQRQSGSDSAFTANIIFPESWRSAWGDGPNFKLAPNGLSIQPMDLNSDSVWSIALKQQI